MTDPFDSLRRPPSGAEPDARFVDDVLARVADRLDDAATGRVRAPQQGALQPTTAPVDLEVVPMSIAPTPSRRPVVWLAAAAVIALVVVGVAALTDDDSSTGTTTSEPATTSAATTTEPIAAEPTLPEVLIGRWMSPPRAVMDDREGISLLFSGRGYRVAPAHANAAPVFNGVAIPSASNIFSVATGDDLSDCADDATGTYTWSVNPSGLVLEVAVESDPCDARAAAIVGTYQRMGCMDPIDNCLGLVDAGEHSSQFIAPLLPVTGEWSAVYGGLTYTVPEGWANYADWPRNFGLTTAEAFAGTTAQETNPVRGVDVMTTVGSLSTVCGGAARQAASLDELVSAFEAVPGLAVGEPETLTVDGHDARAIDVTLAEGVAPDCAGEPVLEWFSGGAGIRTDAPWAITVGERQRMILVDVGTAAAPMVLGILVWDTAPADFDAFVAEAMPIVQSFRFA